MEDVRVQISEEVATQVFCKLRNLMVFYQQRSGTSRNPERGRYWLNKAKEVDDLMTAIAKAMDEAEEAEYRAMWNTEAQEG